MKKIFTESVTVHGDVDQVFQFFIQLDQYGENWMPGISSIKKSTAGPITTGTEFLFLTRGKEHLSTVTDFHEANQVTLTSVQGGFRADYVYHFKQTNDETTQVTLQASCEASGMAKLFAPVIRMAIKKADRGQLTNFKRVLEEKK